MDIFAYELKRALDQNYKNGVHTTAKRVTSRLLEFYKKKQKDSSTQTSNQDMLGDKLLSKIKELHEDKHVLGD